MHDIVDLRSDTLTCPPRHAGGDGPRRGRRRCLGGRPTVRRLEEMAARRTGKDAALFVSSGHRATSSPSSPRPARPGDRLDRTRTSSTTRGRRRGLRGVRPCPCHRARLPHRGPGSDNVRPSNIHIPATGLVCVENTHNRHGGTCCTPEDIARGRGGPRSWRAVPSRRRAHLQPAVASAGPWRLRAALDSSPSVSPRLGRAGRLPDLRVREFIAHSRRVRKMLAAACGRSGARRRGTDRPSKPWSTLAEDHDHGQAAGPRLAELPRCGSIRQGADEYRHLPRWTAMVARPSSPRAVCPQSQDPSDRPGGHPVRDHKDVDREDIDRALDAFREITAHLVTGAHTMASACWTSRTSDVLLTTKHCAP